MGKNTKIEWAKHTFNLWIGCTKISPGCANCYAVNSTPTRVARSEGRELWGATALRQKMSDGYWKQLSAWNKEAKAEGVPARVFISSLCDAMEEHVDPTINAMMVEQRERLYKIIPETPWLTYVFVTKRPANYARFLPTMWLSYPQPNVWLGATVECQSEVKRIPILLSVPAVRHCLSCEPLLEEVDLCLSASWIAQSNPLHRLDWVKVGGESGDKPRRMRGEWVRSLKDQCEKADVMFHFKQWGEFNEAGERVGKHAAGRVLDGAIWDGVPERTL